MENIFDINIATETLRQKLIDDVNSSGLPISTIYLIVKELQWNTEKTYYATLNASAQQPKDKKESAAKEEKIEDTKEEKLEEESK